jgi:hypothetical protein
MTSLFWPAASTAAVGFGVYAFVRGFQSLRLQRVIRDTPTARIRSLAMGLVELQGRVHARSRMSAPFSARSCAWWEVELQTLRRSKNGFRQWGTVHREHSGRPFYLEDETGTALVYPEGARVNAGNRVEEETHGFGVPEPYAGWMAERQLPLRMLWSMGPMRFRERILDEGQRVYVLGRANPKPHAVSISMDDEEVMLATGTDAIGAAHVRHYDGECSAVVRRGPKDPAFLISDRSEKTMTLEYGFQAFFGFVGGPLLTLFGLWCLIELAKSGDLPFGN